jgi:hypothetical protein
MRVIKDIAVRFAAVVTVDATGLRQDKAFVDRFTDLLVETGRYPLPVPYVPPNVILPLPWLAASSPDATTVINLFDDHFEFTFLGSAALERQIAVPTVDEFAVDAGRALSTALALSERRATRIGLVLDTMATDRVPRRCDALEVGMRLLHTPQDRDDRRMTEWLWRYAARLVSDHGNLNTIATLAGVAGRLAGAPFAGVTFQMDANTPPEDTRPRFEPRDVEEVLHRLQGAAIVLEAEVDELVGEY